MKEAKKKKHKKKQQPKIETQVHVEKNEIIHDLDLKLADIDKSCFENLKKY